MGGRLLAVQARYRTRTNSSTWRQEYKRRGLSLSAIVCDFFHWTASGDWKFDPAEWPDPAAMQRELAELGIRLVVSVWPSVCPLSENHPLMEQRGYFIGTQYGPMAHADWPDKEVASTVQVAFYNATNPEARDFLWSRVEGQLPRSVRHFGLLAGRLRAELEPRLREPALQRVQGLEVGNLYPRENARTFYEGMLAAGETEVVTLNRSAWAGGRALRRRPVVRRHRHRLRDPAPPDRRGPRHPRSPASPGGTPTSAASTAATPATRRTAR